MPVVGLIVVLPGAVIPDCDVGLVDDA